ncbi:MAG: aldo/keto reductase [Acidimicrobiales bacterium]
MILGRTGLEVSVAGLGCGGHSRLGQTRGASEAESIQVVKRALDLGITYIDTARAYGTEAIVGKAVRGRRDEVTISTKASPDTPRGPVSAAGLRASVQHSLDLLDTDRIDVFHLHGVGVDNYRRCREDLVPELESLRDEGLVRFIALSERFGADPGHAMLASAFDDDCWDVAMVGFNLLNQSARDRVLPATRRDDVGVEVMFAVRRSLSQPDELRRVVAQLLSDGLVPTSAVVAGDPLGFLVGESGARSVVDAAYRFARREPGCHVVLTGTGNLAHLEENVASINSPPLPAELSEALARLFGHLDHLSGN